MIKRKRLKLFSIILILFISIGFAYLSTNLFMNGLIGYRGNSWSIYFDNIQVIYDNVGVTDPVISNDKLTVNLNIPFSEPGECYKFSVDVVNNGTIDAMLNEVVKTGINSSNKDYLSYNVNYYDGTELKVNDAIKAGSKTRIVIEFDYKYEITIVAPAGNQNFTLSLNYVQADDDANYLAPMYGSSGNNIFVVNNAKSNSLSNLRIYGNTSQAQYSGQNLYDYKNISDVTNGASADSDGWISFSYDNSAGTSTVFSNYVGPELDVVVGETYTIVMEVKVASGTGTFYPSSILDIDTGSFGQFIDKPFELSDLSQNLGTYIYTAVAREADDSGLRPFLSYEAGESGSLKVRLSVIKGTGVTADNFVYEKYVGGVPSPNMNYPQDVVNLTGDSSLKFMGKNLFKGSFSPITYDNQIPVAISDRITINSYDNNNLNFTFNDNRHAYVLCDAFKVKKNTTYTISYNRTNTRTDDTRFYIYYVTEDNDYSKFNVYYNEEGEIKHTFTTTDSGIIAFAWGGNNTFSGETIDIANIQLEEGNSSTDYEAYKEIVYPISLGSLELNSVSGSTDYIYLRNGNWYINKSTNKVKITGEFIYYSVGNHFYSEFIGNYRKKNNVPISTHYIGFSNVENLAQFIPMYENSAYDLIGFNNTTLYRRTYIKALSTTNELNNFLNNNDVYLYYVLDNTEDVLIEDTKLINQLNAILSTNLTEGFNTVQFISSVDASISFDYIEG